MVRHPWREAMAAGSRCLPDLFSEGPGHNPSVSDGMAASAIQELCNPQSNRAWGAVILAPASMDSAPNAATVFTPYGVDLRIAKQLLGGSELNQAVFDNEEVQRDKNPNYS